MQAQEIQVAMCAIVRLTMAMDAAKQVAMMAGKMEKVEATSPGEKMTTRFQAVATGKKTG